MNKIKREFIAKVEKSISYKTSTYGRWTSSFEQEVICGELSKFSRLQFYKNNVINFIELTKLKDSDRRLIKLAFSKIDFNRFKKYEILDGTTHKIFDGKKAVKQLRQTIETLKNKYEYKFIFKFKNELDLRELNFYQIKTFTEFFYEFRYIAELDSEISEFWGHITKLQDDLQKKSKNWGE